MALVSFRSLLAHAREHRYGLSIVQAGSLNNVDSALAAAHDQRAPIVLNPAPGPHRRETARALFAACEAAASEARVPVALMGFQDTAADALATNIRWGCNVVHVTPAHGMFPDAVAEMKSLTQLGRQCGIVVGAALPGQGQDGAAEAQDTRPPVAECVAFAARAELDFFEADIAGTSEGGRKRVKFDYDRLRRINESLSVPLMVRVNGEAQPDQVYRLVENGVALTHHGPGHDNGDAGAMTGHMKTWGSAGRAAEVLAHCCRWATVEHIVEFNVQTEALPRLDEILEKGRRQLAAIPGVRRVATGKAMAEDAKYRFCWIVTFANEKIIDFYRTHPIHVEYADSHFRPVAGDRLTIDFRMTVD